MSIAVLFMFCLILCIAVPQQQSLIGPSQQTVSKHETETKVEVVKPSDSDKSNSEATNEDHSTKACSAKGSEQKKESEVVGVLLISVSSVVQICPGLTLIRCTQISISVTKCLIALLLNFNITRFPEYRQLM